MQIGLFTKYQAFFFLLLLLLFYLPFNNISLNRDDSDHQVAKMGIPWEKNIRHTPQADTYQIKHDFLGFVWIQMLQILRPR